MRDDERNDLVDHVLQRYPGILNPGTPVRLGNRGGFSGARLWRLDSAAGPLCLRAWPVNGPSPEKLYTTHRLMHYARANGLNYVPAVLPSAGGQTCIELGGRIWELTTWQPGRADFHANPTDRRLAAACVALARLHDCWLRIPWDGLAIRPTSVTGGRAICPGVLRRLHAMRDWQALLASGWQPVFAPGPLDLVRPWAERAWQLLPRWIEHVQDLLRPWLERPVSVLQPCLCDVWHDHVLFEGDKVTGLVDYGGVKWDHVAVDLARLLGSLMGDDRRRWQTGLRAYAAVRPLGAEDEALAYALGRTGTVVAACNWLRWLYHEGRQFEDRAVVAARLAAVVRRMEGWG